ncbi:MAG TPA: hypothetical protein VMR45_02145 [Patescibacteria group bacterium]|nr:hypothetical protein [Patescibacteria group bacterium]
MITSAKSLVKKTVRILAAIALLTLCTAGIQIPAKQAAADIGPAPIFAQGGSLQNSTAANDISMNYEKVTLTYGNPVREMNGSQELSAYMPAHVSAIFKMKNTANVAEKMDVYFPLSDSLFVGGYSEDSSNITNFTVDDTELSRNNIVNIPTTINGQTQSMPVYQWEQNFAANSTTTISIEYDTKSGKDFNVYYLTYVLGTGRDWKGSITSGEIDFVLPQSLTSYSVLNKAPLIDENKIPYKVSGNTITVPLSNYEPTSNDVIALGVYDPDTVKSIELLKKQPATFANSLKIAGMFRGLSTGGHCIFCTGSASQQAQNYYSLALDKATSKDEVNAVLTSYAYGDNTDPTYNTLDNLFAFFVLAKDKDCDLQKFECATQEKQSMLEQMRDMPLWPSDQTTVFLTKYSCKMRAYDKTEATAVDTYLGKTSDCTVKKNSSTNTTKTTSKTTAAKKDNKNKIILISSAAVLGVGIIAVIVFVIIRKRRQHSATKSKPAAPAAATMQKLEEKDTKMPKEDKK